jgi:chaperone required for assembly of F1-ATPase
MKGWELFEVVQLARQLSRRWAEFTEVEWVLSEGRAVVLDGRPVRFSPVADNEEGI